MSKTQLQGEILYTIRLCQRTGRLYRRAQNDQSESGQIRRGPNRWPGEVAGHYLTPRPRVGKICECATARGVSELNENIVQLKIPVQIKMGWAIMATWKP